MPPARTTEAEGIVLAQLIQRSGTMHQTMNPSSIWCSTCLDPIFVCGSQIKSRFSLLGCYEAICRGGGPWVQGVVRSWWYARAWSPLPLPRSLERARREASCLWVCCSDNFIFFRGLVSFGALVSLFISHKSPVCFQNIPRALLPQGLR